MQARHLLIHPSVSSLFPLARRSDLGPDLGLWLIAVNMKNANGVILVVAVEFLHNPVINYITPCTCSGRWATIQLKTWVASTASVEVRPKSAKSRTVVAVIVRVARVAACFVAEECAAFGHGGLRQGVRRLGPAPPCIGALDSRAALEVHLDGRRGSAPAQSLVRLLANTSQNAVQKLDKHKSTTA